jgi:hypothetical protein
MQGLYPLYEPVHAPVADPGFTKKRPSYSIAWKLIELRQDASHHVEAAELTHVCVCPETSTSTSICRANALRASRSPVGTHWCP